ncbi:C-terminal binding protein (plasmid) [Aminobacter sp. SR38]|uniref:C-terminal binding protein n=1 Tax=Aminobacter sp. SR38 TaxID=2774562 RepID=UPI001783FF98|nr:C-terminal binding protein [Aminobacter sp. SR38]QOF75511.1 C-terminal binding protein [Aminobacter sp. SR38]
MQVVVTDTVFPDLNITEAILTGVADVRISPPNDRAALKELVRNADAILNCYAPVDADLIAAMQNCRIIARSGIGTDTIDIAAATAKGIKVTNVPDYCVHEVADHAVALMLSLMRGIHAGAAQTTSGGWNLDALRPMDRIQGKMLGLVGFGKIGSALATRARAFGMKVRFYDPYYSAEVPAEFHRDETLEATLAQSDVLSLHVPLNASTRHLIRRETLGLVSKGTIVINTSRGGLIDTEALLAALDSKHLGGVGLDVLEVETGREAARFAPYPNAIVTPHAAFYSEAAIVELQTKCSEDILRALTGQEPRYWLNRGT